MESYTAFSTAKFRFIDSYAHLNASLENLVANLSSSGPAAFEPVQRFLRLKYGVVDPVKLELLLRKGVYPYLYITSFEVFDETELPPIEAFYNDLSKEACTEEDYAHAQKVWKEFDLKSLNEMVHLYISSDVVLLDSVLQQYRTECLSSYNLFSLLLFSSDQAALFNEYFYEQFSQESDYGIDIDFRDDCFSSLVFSREDVLLILKKLNPNKAPGPDGINGKVLKNCAQSLAYPLSVLFNLSFSTGCIPPDWKLALVVPVHKKGDKSSVENYRPISLTSLVMKVFERCIKTALYAACSDLLDNRQHGFVNERSCTTQMIPFTDNLALALNNRSRIDVIYFDFAKAFDSVSHDLILNKLKNIFNVDGLMLKFIKSYLEGRQQQVVVGGQTSSSLPVRSGVPQGSILGPLLFVIFINDMFSCVSEGTNIALYADDTKIWREIIGYPDHHIIQNDINRLYDWSVRNRMKFHPQKCKALSVSLQRNVLDNLPFNTFFYKLSGSDIDFVPSQSDLGVAINSRFNWGA